MNKVLVDNAILGPWIHVGSRMQLLAAAHSGDELTARAKVTGNYEKKGHRFVELDALVVANGTHAAGALPAHRDLPAARAGGGVGRRTSILVIARSVDRGNPDLCGKTVAREVSTGYAGQARV